MRDSPDDTARGSPSVDSTPDVAQAVPDEKGHSNGWKKAALKLLKVVLKRIPAVGPPIGAFIELLDELRGWRQKSVIVLAAALFVLIGLGGFYGPRFLRARKVQGLLVKARVDLREEGPGAAEIGFDTAITAAEKLQGAERVYLFEGMIEKAHCIHLSGNAGRFDEARAIYRELLNLGDSENLPPTGELEELDYQNDQAVVKQLAYATLGVGKLYAYAGEESRARPDDPRFEKARLAFKKASDRFGRLDDEHEKAEGRAQVILGQAYMHINLEEYEDAADALRELTVCKDTSCGPGKFAFCDLDKIKCPEPDCRKCSLVDRQRPSLLDRRYGASFLNYCADIVWHTTGSDAYEKDRAVELSQKAIAALNGRPAGLAAKWKIKYVNLCLNHKDALVHTGSGETYLFDLADEIMKQWTLVSKEDHPSVYLQQRLARAKYYYYRGRFSDAIDLIAAHFPDIEKSNLTSKFPREELAARWLLVGVLIDGADQDGEDLERARKLYCHLERYRDNNKVTEGFNDNLERTSKLYTNVCTELKLSEVSFQCGP